jgi:hypothetical protein
MKKVFGTALLVIGLVACPAPTPPSGGKQSRTFDMNVFPSVGVSGQKGTITFEYDPNNNEGIRATIKASSLGAFSSLVLEFRTAASPAEVCTAGGTAQFNTSADSNGDGSSNAFIQFSKDLDTFAKLGDFVALYEVLAPSRMPLCLDIRGKTF